MRAALYTRVSTKDKGQTTENQIAQLEAFALSQGWSIVLRFEDRKSGKNSDRDQFQEMFAAASRREFDVLLFWSLDRLTREGALATLNHLQRLTGYGVGYRSFTEQYLDTCGLFKDAVVSILATIAKQERARLSERVLAGLERARAQGKQLGKKKLKISEKRITELAQQGYGARRIARELGKSEPTIRRRMKALGVYKQFDIAPIEPKRPAALSKTA